jgi:hypothetical protein
VQEKRLRPNVHILKSKKIKAKAKRIKTILEVEQVRAWIDQARKRIVEHVHQDLFMCICEMYCDFFNKGYVL